VEKKEGIGKKLKSFCVDRTKIGMARGGGSGEKGLFMVKTVEAKTDSFELNWGDYVTSVQRNQSNMALYGKFKRGNGVEKAGKAHIRKCR